MFRERVLSFDLGLGSDRLYWGSYLPGGSTSPTSEYMTQKFQEGLQKRSTATPALPVYFGKETIDETQRGYPEVNDVYHLKSVGIQYPYLAITRNLGNPRTATWQYFWKQQVGAITPVTVWQQTVSHQLAAQRAWWSMQPRFEGELSLLNFLFELKDFRDISKYIWKGFQKSPQLLDYSRKQWPRFKRELDRLTGGSLTLPAAKAVVIKNFAWDPTMSDLTALMAQAQQIVEIAEEEFAAAGLLEQKSHYSEILDSSSSFGPISPPLATGIYREIKYTATMRYKYTYLSRQTLDRMMHYWGVYGNAEAYWNMVPLTFLFDYWIGISKSLHAMRTDPNITLNPTSFCESVVNKSTTGRHIVPHVRNVGFIVNGGTPIIGDIPRPVLISGQMCKEYHRFVSKPSIGLYVPRVKMPSRKQWVNMAALARLFISRF